MKVNKCISRHYNFALKSKLYISFARHVGKAAKVSADVKLVLEYSFSRAVNKFFQIFVMRSDTDLIGKQSIFVRTMK